MIYLTLFFLFAKIGLFAFGGGFASLAIIESELLSRNWCTSQEFADIAAVAQITPGPIIINTATFVGKNLGGVQGGIIATLGFVFPAVIIIICMTVLSQKAGNCQIICKAVRGIRAGVAGLILCAVLFFMENSILNQSLNLKKLVYDFSSTVNGWNSVRIVIPAVMIFALNFIFAKKFKLSIYLSILISVIIGTPLMYFYNFYF